MLLAQVSPHFPSLPSLSQVDCALSGAYSQVGCVCSRIPWASLIDSPVRLGISPTFATTTDFIARALESLVSRTESLGVTVCLAPLLPLSLSTHECGTTWLASPSLSHSVCCFTVHPLLWLPMSTPPTSLNECFFNSSVVRVPCSMTFWLFWFFVFKLVVILLLVV